MGASCVRGSESIMQSLPMDLKRLDNTRQEDFECNIVIITSSYYILLTDNCMHGINTQVKK